MSRLRAMPAMIVRLSTKIAWQRRCAGRGAKRLAVSVARTFSFGFVSMALPNCIRSGFPNCKSIVEVEVRGPRVRDRRVCRGSISLYVYSSTSWLQRRMLTSLFPHLFNHRHDATLDSGWERRPSIDHTLKLRCNVCSLVQAMRRVLRLVRPLLALEE